MKERIGDAIRNAAMRFGVALDLWAKQDLHDSKTEQDRTPPPPSNEEPVDPRERKRRQMFALMREKGVTGDERKVFIGTVFGWDDDQAKATSSNDLTDQQLTAVIASLRALPDAAQEAGT